MKTMPPRSDIKHYYLWSAYILAVIISWECSLCSLCLPVCLLFKVQSPVYAIAAPWMDLDLLPDHSPTLHSLGQLIRSPSPRQLSLTVTSSTSMSKVLGLCPSTAFINSFIHFQYIRVLAQGPKHHLNGGYLHFSDLWILSGYSSPLSLVPL